MFKGPSASSTPTTISSTTSNRSLNRVHCSFSFDEKKKKKQNPLIYIRTGVRIRSIAGYVHSRARASSNVIFLSSRIFCIICPLATFAYMLHTYIHNTYTYIYTYTRTTYVHTHTFVHTNRHIKRPFSRCTRDIKSSNKKKKHERKAKKRKRRKKRKGKGKRTRGAFSLVTFASARYFTSIFHRFID